MPLHQIACNVVKPFLSIHGIHPLKQHNIEELIEHTRVNFPYVTHIAVFGSTVDGRCRVDSDIDIVVWGADDKKFYPPDNDTYDVFRAGDVMKEPKLREDIENEGVVVYVKDFD